MKLKLLFLFVVVALVSCAGGNKKAEAAGEVENAPKAIVCYFSATGTTAAQAQRLAQLLNADLHEITPEARYTSADLDWREAESRSTLEMKDPACRPAIVDSIANIADYEIVFVGYPNWWNTAPRIVNTFIEANDLAGKTVVPFMTSGGDSIDNSVKDLKEAYPSLVIADGLLMNDVSDEEIEAWVVPLGIAVVK